jgi:NAD(P)-dependent dehydrogenase (short-subunit alcohol dehydrogenase family)
MNVRDMFDLNGKTALVTGGTGLYGMPISEALAEAGAHVVIASRNLQHCRDWASELSARGLKASGENYDQADEQSILRLRDQILSKGGAVDVLVNNSMAAPMKSYKDGIDAWRQSMEVNATGLFAISKAFLDPMMDRRQGSIINISSIQGVVAPDFQNYAGTQKSTSPDYHFHKHGMIGLTKYLAALAGPHGVRVNAISPGGYDPEAAKEPFLSQYCRRVFLGRMAERDDLKGVVVFLAGEASRYITGQNLVVDGGYTC